MKIKITTDRRPFIDEEQLEKGAEVEVSDEEAKVFIENGFAVEVTDKPKRARNKKGQLMADDPSTPDVNEAWEGGEAPE
jgi:hypothetical protein